MVNHYSRVKRMQKNLQKYSDVKDTTNIKLVTTLDIWLVKNTSSIPTTTTLKQHQKQTPDHSLSLSLSLSPSLSLGLSLNLKPRP